MHGVVTLAGEGTRMLPWTRGIRKEFLPLFDWTPGSAPVLKPVAHLVLETMIGAGADDVTLVVNPRDLSFVQNYFTVDREFLRRHADKADRLAETRRFYRTLSGLRLHFAIQNHARGFGDAVLQAQPFVAGGNFILQAGDAVLIEPHRGALLGRLARLLEAERLDAVILVRRVSDPSRYGVVEVDPWGRFEGLRRFHVIGMEEKPAHPRSSWAATAAYAFSPRLFEGFHAVLREKKLRELEVTDAIRWLIAHGGRVAALVLTPTVGEWRSVGSPEGYLRAVARTRNLLARSAPTTRGRGAVGRAKN
jgi:dTDP-glucose pyrophosphorylase